MTLQRRRRHRRATATRPRARRIALFLDIENLCHEPRARGDWGAVRAGLTSLLEAVSRRGTVVVGVACCDHTLAAGVAFELACLGVRVFRHHGGPDAADRDLVARLRDHVPPSCDTVIIGSGDHAFVDIARALRADGKRVEVLGPTDGIARALRDAADRCDPLDRIITLPDPSTQEVAP